MSSNKFITLYTHTNNPLTREFWKWVARKIVGKYSGPNAVEDSLLRGLKELDVEFRRNVKPQTGDVAVVLSGVQALREAIALKQKGVIKKLIAGPNVVARPHDFGRIMLNEEIDIVLVPSKWTADFWKLEAPELNSKIQVWPAGVSIAKASTRTGSPVIYNKLGDTDVLNKVKAVVGSDARIFTYGDFKQADYLTALTDAPYLIYLAQSESQGLAIQEAWAHNVPTLINKSEHLKSGDLSFEAPQINCPYLTPELGVVFGNTEELAIMIKQTAPLHPKQYCDQHLSDRVSTEKLLKLL